MISKLEHRESLHENLTALNKRSHENTDHCHGLYNKRENPGSITWSKLGYMLPILWLSGFFAGIGFMTLTKFS